MCVYIFTCRGGTHPPAYVCICPKGTHSPTTQVNHSTLSQKPPTNPKQGLAEWVGVWDVDEFVTPRRQAPHHAKLLTLLDQYAAPERNGGREVGFLLFTSYSHALPLDEAAALEADAGVHLPLNDTDAEINWVGRRFAETREDGVRSFCVYASFGCGIWCGIYIYIYVSTDEHDEVEPSRTLSFHHPLPLPDPPL